MNELTTCGQGLAERSVLPERMGALAIAMAENLERHQRALDQTDTHAAAEREAYDAVAGALRGAAAQFRTTAERMAGYRDLPMARHDERALLSPPIRDAFARFIEREGDLSALLNTAIPQDRAMLEGESSRANATGVGTSPVGDARISLRHVPITRTGMLIRKPVNEVFEAIVNPEITNNFWFTKSSGHSRSASGSNGAGKCATLRFT